MITSSTFSVDNPRYLQILSRNTEIPAEILSTVEKTVSDVRARGDAALFEYMKRFDGVDLDATTIRVGPEEFDRAADSVDPRFKQAVKQACDNLFAFHRKQMPVSFELEHPRGVSLRRKYLPIQRVGVCVPSLAAPLCSSLMMDLVPAIVAGVPEIYIASAPRGGRVDPHILYVAGYLGARTFLKISGAQAVAAMAYGTESVPRVDKIVGPGGSYVATAKRVVNGVVGIDSIAGPSEIVIIADDAANPRYIAADLLSQAEHGTGYECSVAFVLSSGMADRICAEADALIAAYGLAGRVERALRNFGNVFVVDSLDTAIRATNAIAPEHVEVLCQDDIAVVDAITSAGAIYVGEWSPEPVGDYFCGTNHVLPTNGTARFASSLGVGDFMRSMSIVRYSERELRHNAELITTLAEAEGMRAHALSVQVRQG